MSPQAGETHGAKYQGPWCLRCGYPAKARESSLDPNLPLADCRRGYPDHKGCGRVLATFDREEAELVWSRARSRRITGRHNQHVRAGKPATYCLACPSEPTFRQVPALGSQADPTQGPAVAPGRRP